MITYNGSPWRSRFLRAPKIGLELVARSDFAPVRDLATVRLGAKTGNDRFFFLGKSQTRAARAGRLRVKGLAGWEGDIPKADLLPALQSPKDLDTERDGMRVRLAAVPPTSGLYYLAVRLNRVDSVVREYVHFGEENGVHKGDLVKSNAADGEWFRQTRERVTSRWALPYNSGYDYGAVDNTEGALLNGRFVGVDALAEVDQDLLGAVLNSTFTMVARLLEGVATGNEGAFDVGPPAVRVMRVPDPRIIARSAGEAEVRAAWAAILADGALPHSPLANGLVPQQRQRLDRAILLALGLSRGDAAVLLDRVYSSYARWRGAVEGVEDAMQLHRKALAKRGGTRSTSPVVRATRTVLDEMQSEPRLLAELAVLDASIALVDPVLPRDRLPGQGLLFDATSVIDQDGNLLDLGSVERLALAAFMRGLGMSGPLPLADDAGRCGRILGDATAAVDHHRAEATRRAGPHVSDDLVEQVADAVVAKWIADSISELRVAYAAIVPTVDEELEEASLFNPTPLVPPFPSQP